jgi:hypothetical protein
VREHAGVQAIVMHAQIDRSIAVDADAGVFEQALARFLQVS